MKNTMNDKGGKKSEGMLNRGRAGRELIVGEGKYGSIGRVLK